MLSARENKQTKIGLFSRLWVWNLKYDPRSAKDSEKKTTFYKEWALHITTCLAVIKKYKPKEGDCLF